MLSRDNQQTKVWLIFNKYGIILDTMKYISIFFTILLIWIAIILMALTRSNPTEVFELFLAAIASTLVLFLIGFTRK